MIEFKRFYYSFFIGFLLLIGIHIIPLVIIDPLNILKLEITKNQFFIKEMRFQAASIINNMEFDSAIIGSSMAENFNAKEANTKLNGNFINLSLSGSLLKERHVVLNYLLAKKMSKTL
jgi:hypothetical protein